MGERRFIVKKYDATTEEEKCKEQIFLCYIFDDPLIILKISKLETKYAEETKVEPVKAEIIMNIEEDQLILPVAAERALFIMKTHKSRVVSKKKYAVGTFTVFEYEGAHKGLTIAKLTSNVRGQLPVIPQHLLLGREITSDQTYSDRILARFGAPPVGPRAKPDQDIT